MAVLRRIINRIRSQREEGEVQATNVARYDLDVVEVQSSIIADLAEVNRLLLEELENYRSMEDRKQAVTNDDRRHKRRSRRPGTDVRAVGRS